MKPSALSRANRAIDAAVRLSMRLSEAVAFTGMVVALILLTQALPLIPWLSE